MIKLDQKAEIFYKKLADKGHEIRQLTRDIPEIGLNAGAIFTRKPDSELEYLDKKVYECVGNNTAMSITFVKGGEPLYLLPARVVEKQPDLFVEYIFNRQ